MRIWPSSWNWKIVLIAALLGGVGGAILGTQRSAALLHSGEFPTNSAESIVVSGSDGWVLTLLYGILGASVAMTILAPSLVVATLFQAREMSIKARLKSKSALQQAFPGASPPASEAARAGSGGSASGTQTGRPL